MTRHFSTISLSLLILFGSVSGCSSSSETLQPTSSEDGDGDGVDPNDTGGGMIGDGDGDGTGGTEGDGDVPGTGGGVISPPGAAITATDAAAAMGRGVNLGQMFENNQHPRTLEAATAKIDAYYDMGYRNVRIPVTWTENVGTDMLVNDPTVGDVNREHPRVQVITQVIDYALSKPDLYVILNAHHEKALKTESRSVVLERLWQDLSEMYGDRDYRLLFEILNEPHRDDTTPMPAADLRLMTGLAYDKIRAVNPDRIVIIGGNQWFGAHEVPAVWTSLDEVGGGQDPYVMATFHHYNPWTFCGDNQGDYADAWTDADLSGPMDTMQNWADTIGNGMPVYIGEWGVGYGSVLPTMDCNNIRSWYQKMDAEFASSYGMPTGVWDDGGWFRIFDHGTNTFNNNLAECILGTCDWNGTERFNAACLEP